MQYFFFLKLQFISFTFNLQFFNSSFLQFNLVRVEKLQIESKTDDLELAKEKGVYFFYCMKKRIFIFRQFVKRTEETIFSLVFVCFHFTEKSYLLNFPSNENVRKQHLSANAYSRVNIKFSYTIAARKDEIFYVTL